MKFYLELIKLNTYLCFIKQQQQNTKTNNMNYDKLKNVLILETKQQVLNEQKKRTNGSRKSLFQRKSEQVFNNVANLIETNDFKLKRKLDRQAKREFYKNKRMSK